MKRLIKPSSLALYLLMFITFFIVGLFYANLIDAGEGQMLAAAAIVLGWGVLFGGIAFVGSLFIAYHTDPKIIKRLNWGLLVFIILTIGIVRLLNPRQDTENREEPPPATKPTAPAVPVQAPAMAITVPIAKTAKTKLNLGFFKPDIYNLKVLYFYADVALDQSVHNYTPTDSITFVRHSNNRIQITHSPSWFVREQMQLDYDHLYFPLQSMSRSFVEIARSTETNATIFTDRSSGEILFWEDFLLTMHSVEFPPNSNQKIYKQPSDDAGEALPNTRLLKPIAVKREWMKVGLMTESFEYDSTGWIRWKKDGELLVLYNPLS